MATRSFVRMLEMKLDEVFFVFWHLPKQLTSAAKRLGLQNLRDDVLARAATIRARASKLLTTLGTWGGRKPAPCDCADLDSELNELRHAAKSPGPEWWLYASALRITRKLNGMVRERLLEARRLAHLLGERVLAADIKQLLDEDNETAAHPSLVNGRPEQRDGT